MRKFTKIIALALITSIVSFSSMAQAEPKPWIWSWWESHWDGLDFEPYLENGKHPHNSQWDNTKWTPEEWAKQYENGGKDIIDGFYAADIIRDQYIDDDVPVLEVGPSFYSLGGFDKRRVAEMVDNVYGITTSKTFGMYMLVDWKTEEAIGSYTQYGLQLQ